MQEKSVDLENADCMTWLASQKEESFQLIILDPPYNVGYKYNQYQDTKPQHHYLLEQLLVLSHCQRLLKPNGSIFYLNYPEVAAQIWARVDFLDYFEWINWTPHAHVRGTPLRKASRAWLWFSKGKPLINQAAFQTDYRNPTDHRIKKRIEAGLKPACYDWIDLEPVKNTSKQKRNHPCQVPEEMVERFILGTSNPGDLVGDCYTGSGTTGICSVRHGRNFAGCELDPLYVEVAKTAIEAELALKVQPKPLFAHDGKKSLDVVKKTDHMKFDLKTNSGGF
jgi:DNA modification methylase